MEFCKNKTLRDVIDKEINGMVSLLISINEESSSMNIQSIAGLKCTQIVDNFIKSWSLRRLTETNIFQLFGRFDKNYQNLNLINNYISLVYYLFSYFL